METHDDLPGKEPSLIKWFAATLALATMPHAVRAQQQAVPAAIGETATATPSDRPHTGQVVAILLTATSYGPDYLEFNASRFHHEFSITNIDY